MYLKSNKYLIKILKFNHNDSIFLFLLLFVEIDHINAGNLIGNFREHSTNYLLNCPKTHFRYVLSSG